MKKLLALLGAASAVAAPATAVIACVQPQTDNNTNNGGDTDTDGEDTGKVDEDKAAELEANPYDLSKMEDTFDFRFKDTTIQSVKQSVLAKINEDIKEYTVQLTIDDIKLEGERNFVKKPTDIGDNPGDIEEDKPNSLLIAGDEITISVNGKMGKYFAENKNFVTVIKKFDLAETPYKPNDGETIAQFITRIQEVYIKNLAFAPDFHARVDMVYFDSEGIEHEVTTATALTLEYGNNAYVNAVAKTDDNLFEGSTVYKSEYDNKGN